MPLYITIGIRRCIGHGYTFPDEIMDLVKDAPQFSDPDHCTVCFGTDKSGISLLCDNCDKSETHLHCLRKPLLLIPMGNWYCDECCALLNLPFGTILDDPNAVQSPEPGNENAFLEIKPKGKGGRPKGSGSSVGNVNGTKKGSKPSKVGGKSSKSMNIVNDDDNPLLQHNLLKFNSYGYNSQEPLELNKQNVKEDDSVKEDDKCFVCGEGGKLILCDFPNCPRVYHHVCVLKTVPTTPYEEISIANASTLSSQFGSAINDMNDAWFCPSHKCICCDILDETSCPIRSLTLPLTLQPSMVMQETDSLQTRKKIFQKSLEYCSTCPFSICHDCDKDIAGRRSTLSTRKVNGIKISNCRLCQSARPTLKLAKALEKALVKMLKSRLSLPFLHPFLPGIIRDDDADFSISGGHKRNIASISSSSSYSGSNKPGDLIEILEAVRNLKYKSSDEFFNDIQYLRTILQQEIEKQNNVKNVNEISPLLLAFDTLLGEAKLSIQKSLRNADIDSEQTDDDPNRNVKQKGDEEDIGAEHSIPQIENSLLRLWRAECEKNVFRGIKERNNDSHYRVIGRSIAEWEAYINEGIMPDTFYDGYDDGMNGIFSRERNYESNIGSRMLARSWVNMYGISSSDYINDIEAAGLMLGMTGSNSRETVTLMEDNYTDEQLAWSKMRRITDENGRCDDSEVTNLANDETLIMLDRLKDMSTKALHLENKLRNSYMENMRNLLDVDTQQIKLGEMSILKELKLSNDNLRWRLKQKQRVLLSTNLIINNLKDALSKAEMKYEDCNKELQKLKDENIIKLKEENITKLREESKNNEDEINN